MDKIVIVSGCSDIVKYLKNPKKRAKKSENITKRCKKGQFFEL